MEVENLGNHKKRKRFRLDESVSDKKSQRSSEKRKNKIKLGDHGLVSFGEVESCLGETCIDKDKKEEKKKKKRSKTTGNGSMVEGSCIKDYNVHHGKRKSRKNTTEDDASEKENNFAGEPHSFKEKRTKADKSGSEEDNVREGKEINKKEKENTVNLKERVLKEDNDCEGEICISNDVIKKKKKEKKSKSKEHGTLEKTVGTEESLISKDSKRKDKARKKTKSLKPNLEEKLTQKKHRKKMNVQVGDHSENPTSGRTSKKVSFSDNIEIFPLPDDRSSDKSSEEDGESLVQGKRFSKEEDAMVKKAVLDYIETHDLGDKGLYMVLRCKSCPETRHCWKEIGAALPWRPPSSIYYRAHVLFERDENRKWTQEELEIVRRFHQEHGSDWRKLADEIGKHRFHVKDAWRRIKLPDMKKGRWSQDEYQTLYDLVNLDLRMKASEEKKSKHGMLRDNIPWESISDRLATRTNANCCNKWYRQLTSRMVAEGVWADVDDYRLVDALFTLDACSIEDVDWDNLLKHRPGDICRKRWNQMVKHIGDNGNKSFSEQVDILSQRYCANVIEAKEAYDAKPFV